MKQFLEKTKTWGISWEISRVEYLIFLCKSKPWTKNIDKRVKNTLVSTTSTVTLMLNLKTWEGISNSTKWPWAPSLMVKFQENLIAMSRLFKKWPSNSTIFGGNMSITSISMKISREKMIVWRKILKSWGEDTVRSKTITKN